MLYDGILYAQTDKAMVHAIDAETGATLWAKQIGRPEHPSMTPGVGRSLLAIVNGSRLYVANRLNGKILLETDIDGAPGAGPAVSDQRVYVPTVKGLLLSYRVEELANPLKKTDKEDPLSPETSTKAKTEDNQNLRLSQQKIRPISCQSKGQTLVQPLVTRENGFEEYVVWPTNEGCMYIGRRGSQRGCLYRSEVSVGNDRSNYCGTDLSASGSGNFRRFRHYSGRYRRRVC